MSGGLSGLARLEAIEDIRQLKARYLMSLDTHDWDTLRTLFADDAVFDPAGADNADVTYVDGVPPGPWTGPETITDAISRIFAGCVSVHHGHTPIIDVLDEDNARGVWALEDWMDFDGRGFKGAGYYHESYRRIGGEWRFARVALTRLRTDYY